MTGKEVLIREREIKRGEEVKPPHLFIDPTRRILSANGINIKFKERKFSENGDVEIGGEVVWAVLNHFIKNLGSEIDTHTLIDIEKAAGSESNSREVTAVRVLNGLIGRPIIKLSGWARDTKYRMFAKVTEDQFSDKKLLSLENLKIFPGGPNKSSKTVFNGPALSSAQLSGESGQRFNSGCRYGDLNRKIPWPELSKK